MIEKQTIIDILNLLEAKFNTSGISNLEITLYSKLSVLEYCGWLEETMDIIVKKSFQNKVTNKKLIEAIEKKIKDTHNFKYTAFQDMLIYSVGLSAVERLENELKDIYPNQQRTYLEVFKHSLRFTEDRNKFAHTFTGLTSKIFNPKELIDEIEIVFPIFEKIYNSL